MNIKNRIGIITWHYYPNFGSALQAYALHTFINNKGGDATLIDYVVGKRPAFFYIRLFLSYFDSVLPRFISAKIHYRFISFEHKYFKKTKLVGRLEELSALSGDFDTFICGSDQIWAPNVFNDVYMLSFVPDGKRKYSFAASIGLSTIPDTLKSTYKKLLLRFDAITVREEQGRCLLKQEFNIDSTVVLDPTLLMTPSQWGAIAKFPEKPEKYILCYFLGQNESHRLLVEELSTRLGYKIVCLSRYSMDMRPAFTTDRDAGPREFIGYIHNAAFVVTDSFHGLCFSINLNRNFYVVNRFTSSDPINQNSRIMNILNIVKLEDRLIESLPMNIEDINYPSVNERLNEGRKHSYHFLSQVIGL